MNNVTLGAPENFAIELVRRGLPVDYSERVAQELADHERDVLDELRASGLDEAETRVEASRRLGDERALVKKTVREVQRRHWCGRWPVPTFLLGPIGLVIISWVAFALLAYCTTWLLAQMGIRLDQRPDGILSQAEYVAGVVARILVTFVGPAMCLLILARFERKAAMGPAWLWLSTSILAVIASCIWCGFATSVSVNAPADQGLLMVGLPKLKWSHDPIYLAQCLLPFAIGGGFMLRMRQQSRRAELLMLEAHKRGGEYEYAKCA